MIEQECLAYLWSLVHKENPAYNPEFVLEDVDLITIDPSVREVYPCMVEKLFSTEDSDDDSYPMFFLEKTKERVLDIRRHNGVDLCPFKITHLLRGLFLNVLVAQTTEFIGVVDQHFDFQQQSFEGSYEYQQEMASMPHLQCLS